METYTIHQTKRYIFIIELSAQLDKGGNLVCYNSPFATLEQGTKFKSNSTDAATVAKEFLAHQYAERVQRREAFERSLSPFWADVDSRVGMDVCTPFMKKFPKDSFVAYDNGTVWSKTQRTIYRLRNCTAGRLSYPNSCKNVVSFGDDL